MAVKPGSNPCAAGRSVAGATPAPISLESEIRREPNPFKRLWKLLGPGLITGASDDDPSGIGTYASAGAALGYSTLWTALVTFPLMAAVQFTCAKVGLVSGLGLAGVLRRHYRRALLYPVIAALVLANTFNAGADIGAIAAGLNLLCPVLPIPALVVPVGALLLALQIWGSYQLIVRTFKWLTLTLFAYIGACFFSQPDWRQVFWNTVLPTIRFDSQFLTALVAILGTTISPYLFFWQARQEVEEQIARGRKRLWQRQGATEGELRFAAWDVGAGMLLSNVVMFFIILTTAATLHRSGVTEINSAEEAAEALRPLAGDAAGILFALGLVGTGVLAVPILTTCGADAVAEVFRWNHGLDEKPRQARAYYGVITASTLVGLAINFLGINSVRALLWTSVLNGLLTPPLLVVVLAIANNRQVMGHRVNGWALNALVGITALLMSAAALGMIWTWL